MDINPSDLFHYVTMTWITYASKASAERRSVIRLDYRRASEYRVVSNMKTIWSGESVIEACNIYNSTK